MVKTPSRPGPTAGDLTVDELARRAGTTTRNVRAFQTRGLLPRPTLRRRTGFYGPEHLERLRAVLRLQVAGFSLAAIAALFEAWEAGMTLEQLLGLPDPSERRAPSGGDEVAAFEDWPTRSTAGPLAIVPTTVLDQVAS